MRFALLGKDISHSFSPSYFQQKFSELNLDHEYELLDLPDLTQLKSKITELKLSGFNITIPYKQEIIQHLDQISTEAAAANSVNVVKVMDDKLLGYNTDIPAFTQTISPFAYGGLKALIFGTGGSSQAVQFALENLSIEFRTIGRSNRADFSYSQVAEDKLFQNYLLLVNCTPVGMLGREEEKLPLPFDEITDQHICYDLIYNPEETPFLKEAKSNGAIAVNGLEMLKIQADLSWEIWNT
ncbi:shikimate dehydrogenase [bacterium]|nr:shikimate dehydrogenase [bacterium]